MEQENKKFYELSEEERKEKRRLWFKKHKPLFKKILFGAVCIIICLMMIFGLLGDLFFNKPEETSAIFFNMFK